MQDLQKYGAAANKTAHKNGAFWISEAKEHAKNCKPEDVLKVRVGPHVRPHQKRRQLEIYCIHKADPGEGGVRKKDDQ